MELNLYFKLNEENQPDLTILSMSLIKLFDLISKDRKKNKIYLNNVNMPEEYFIFFKDNYVLLNDSFPISVIKEVKKDLKENEVMILIKKSKY